MNILIENKQFKAINEIKSFLDAQNFYGDKYQMSRQKQINASKFWVNYFLPEDTKNLPKLREKIQKYFYMIK